MKKIIFLQAILLVALMTSAQKPKTQASANNAKDNAQKYAANITEAGLKKHLSVIASDSMQGRETGTEGQRKAAAYIEQHFKSLGLSHPASMEGYQQFYPLGKDSVIETTLSINNEKLVWGTDFLAPVTINETASFSGNKIVFAGYGIDDPLYNDYEKIDVKGKIVMIISGEPKQNGNYFLNPKGNTSEWTYPVLTKKLDIAYQKGAIGVLYINTVMDKFSSQSYQYSKASAMYYPGEDEGNKKLPVATLSHAMATKIMGDNMNNIINLAKKGFFLTDVSTQKEMPVSFSIKKHKETITASNVLAVLEGTEKKNEYVFMTAHYDHLGIRNGKIYNGADDDGSGTVAVLQMAEAFAKAAKEGNRPKRTIVFMTVSGEEKGLWGSEYYTDHPVFPLASTSVDLNTDMIGRIDTERKKDDTLNYVYVVGHDKLSTELPEINEGVNNKYTKLVLDYKFDDPNDPNRIYYRSDHYNFARKGVPVLFFYDGMLKADYHQPTDDVEKINWSLYAKRARMIFHTAWEMANRKEILKRDKPAVTE